MLGSLGKLYTAVLLCKADELGILLRGEKKLLPRGVGIAEASVVYPVNSTVVHKLVNRGIWNAVLLAS